MLRLPLTACQYIRPLVRPILTTHANRYVQSTVSRQFSTIIKPTSRNSQTCCHHTTNLNLSFHPTILQTALNISGQLQQTRTVTKFSLKKGKRKTVKAAVKRFFRLEWGGWIRTRAGRFKKLWRKTSKLKRRLKQHVMVNSTQAWMLDKMVTKFWRKPKYYVDDPYRPYHSREYFPATRKHPVKYEK